MPRLANAECQRAAHDISSEKDMRDTRSRELIQNAGEFSSRIENRLRRENKVHVSPINVTQSSELNLYNFT